MRDAVERQKKADDREKQAGRNHRKVFLIMIVVLFFTGIAILSVMAEKPESQWTIMSPLSADTQADSLRSDFSSEGLSHKPSSGEDSGEDNRFPVYIVGEVREPGIYRIASGTFLYQLVEMAGGLTDLAAKASINLAYEITRNQMIRIPSMEEILKGDNGGAADGLVMRENDPSLLDAGFRMTPSKVNINTANETELDTLPGIGTATAKLIIDYRTQNGVFKKIEDIMKIPGIKQSKFARIKDQITV